MPIRAYPLTQSRGWGRHQAGTSYAAIAAADWDPAALRTEQLNDQDIGPILEEAQTGQLPEGEDVADGSTTYESYWAQWKSLAVREGILEHHWESADGPSQIAQIVCPRSRAKDVLHELHCGLSGGHLGVNKTLNKLRQKY
jgi:hypothetical protein